MAGAPRKPTALKVLNGSAAHDKKRLNAEEPQLDPLAVVPLPPAAMPLAGRARAAWDNLAAQAVKMRVLTDADLLSLALTCRAIAEYEAARRDDMAWRRADAAWKRAMAGLGKFGLNPSDRTRVHATQKANDNSMAALMTPKRRTG
jgi:phage terminase small subunit